MGACTVAVSTGASVRTGVFARRSGTVRGTPSLKKPGPPTPTAGGFEGGRPFPHPVTRGAVEAALRSDRQPRRPGRSYLTSLIVRFAVATLPALSLARTVTFAVLIFAVVLFIAGTEEPSCIGPLSAVGLQFGLQSPRVEFWRACTGRTPSSYSSSVNFRRAERLPNSLRRGPARRDLPLPIGRISVERPPSTASRRRTLE
jgi:hypothetical protein